MRRSIFHRNTIYRNVIVEVNIEVLRSRHIKMMEFRSRCCFCVHHEKRTDKLSVRQQSIYCVKNARNALSRKHWMSKFFLFLYIRTSKVSQQILVFSWLRNAKVRARLYIRTISPEPLHYRSVHFIRLNYNEVCDNNANFVFLK